MAAEENRFSALSENSENTGNSADDMKTRIADAVGNAMEALPTRDGRDNNLVQDVVTAIVAVLLPMIDRMGAMGKSKEEKRVQDQLKMTVQKQDFKADELDQRDKCSNVIIRGIQEADGEDCKDTVIKLASDIGVAVQPVDISTCYRMGAVRLAGGRPRPILARFVRLDTRKEILRNKKKLKNHEKQDLRKIMIDEHLTQLRAKLLKSLRDDMDIDRAWVLDGKIWCIKKEDGSKVMINNPDDLFKKLNWSEEKMKNSGLYISFQDRQDPLIYDDTWTNETGLTSKFCSIKLAALNVKGLDSKLNCGILDNYLQNFDIICLSETYTNFPNLKDTDLYYYDVFTMPRRKRHHKYGAVHGLLIAMRPDIFSNAELIENTLSDFTLWVKIGKNYAGFEFILGHTYIPCEGSNFYENDLFDQIEHDVCLLQNNYNVPICLVGDFNARTATLSDFLDIEPEVARITGFDQCNNHSVTKEIFMEMGIPIERHNQDPSTNNKGRKLIELCHSSDLQIVNGRVGEDRGIGKLTCYNTNGGTSTIDYIVASDLLFPNITNFEVDIFDSCMSDVHCPVTMTLNYNGNTDLLNENNDRIPEEASSLKEAIQSEHTTYHFNWDPISANTFKETLQTIKGILPRSFGTRISRLYTRTTDVIM